MFFLSFLIFLNFFGKIELIVAVSYFSQVSGRNISRSAHWTVRLHNVDQNADITKQTDY